MELIMDRTISAATKQALNRKIAEVENLRVLLLGAVEGLREQATADTEGLADAVVMAFDEARTSLASATTPERFNRFVDEFVGPLMILPDGSVQQKQLPPADAEGG